MFLGRDANPPSECHRHGMFAAVQFVLDGTADRFVGQSIKLTLTRDFQEKMRSEIKTEIVIEN